MPRTWIALATLIPLLIVTAGAEPLTSIPDPPGRDGTPATTTSSVSANVVEQGAFWSFQREYTKVLPRITSSSSSSSGSSSYSSFGGGSSGGGGASRGY